MDALHSAMLFWGPANAEMPNNLWLSGAAAEIEVYATLMKTIDANGLKSIDSLMGLHSFHYSLVLPTLHSSLLWLLPHNQYNNWHTIYWYVVNTNGKVWNMVVSPVTSAKEGEA